MREKRSRAPPPSKAIREIVNLDTPQKPAQVKKGFKLTLEDLPQYKEPIVSPKMQKNLRILDLRIDPEGFLFSPKAYDPEWTWQSQAVWLRVNRVRPIRIAKRLNKKLATVKRMFERLNTLTPFYRGVSNDDWATIGNTWVGDKGSERVRNINFGGVFDQNKFVGDEISDMRGTLKYLNGEVIIDERSGQIFEKVGTNNGLDNRFTNKQTPEYTPFDLKEHNKHHEPVSKPVEALKQTMISFDAYEEQERQLLEHEKRKEAKHNTGIHTPRSKHPQKKVAAGHGLSTKKAHTAKVFGRPTISIREKVLELSNWVDYGGN